MIRCEVIENFNLKDYDKIKIVERKGADIKGQLNKGDIFECDENMVDYLTGNNALNKTVVKVIEVKPEKDIREVEFEVRSEEVKELVKEKQKEVEEIIKPKKKKSSKK